MKRYAEEAFKVHHQSIVIDNCCSRSPREQFEVLQCFGHLATSVSIHRSSWCRIACDIMHILAMIGSKNVKLERLELVHFDVNMNVLEPKKQLIVYNVLCQLKELKFTKCNFSNCGLFFYFAKNNVETIGIEICLMDSTTKEALTNHWPKMKNIVLRDEYGHFSKADILNICRQNAFVEKWTISCNILPHMKLLAPCLLQVKELTLTVASNVDLMPLASLPNLTKLVLIANARTEFSVTLFLQILSTHVKLQELELHQVNCFLFPETPMSNNSFTNLKSIKLTAFFLPPIQQLISIFPNIERVQLNGSAFAMQLLPQMLDSLPNLQMLHINFISTQGFRITFPGYDAMLNLCRSRKSHSKNLLIVISRGLQGSTMKVCTTGRIVLFYPADDDAIADASFEFGKDNEFERAQMISNKNKNVLIK